MRLPLTRFDVEMIEVGSYTSHRMEDEYACQLAMRLSLGTIIDLNSCKYS